MMGRVLMEVDHHLKGRHQEAERVGRTCCTQGEGGSEREGPEYLLDAVLVEEELFLTIMMSKYYARKIIIYLEAEGREMSWMAAVSGWGWTDQRQRLCAHCSWRLHKGYTRISRQVTNCCALFISGSSIVQ